MACTRMQYLIIHRIHRPGRVTDLGTRPTADKNIPDGQRNVKSYREAEGFTIELRNRSGHVSLVGEPLAGRSH